MFKKIRRPVLITVMYFALFMIGREIYSISVEGIPTDVPKYIALSGLIGNILLALGCFWELYFAGKFQSK